MEWSSFPLDEDLYGFLSPPLDTPNLSEWTSEENGMFENALTDMDPSSPAFFQNVAAKVPWKTVEEVKLHYESLLNDMEMIEEEQEEEEEDDEGKNIVVEEESPPCKRKTKTGQPRRRGVPWTEEEHQLFLMGLNKYGKGDWRSISRYYVINKTPTQVASHAQKFFRRRTSCTPPDRRRPSIHDVQTVNPPAPQPLLPFSSSALIPSLHHNFNGGAVPILHQNTTFMPPPINSVFPPAAHPGSNQIAPAANYASTSCFLMNQNWG